jgi:hypothetical protein
MLGLLGMMQTIRGRFIRDERCLGSVISGLPGGDEKL